MNVNVDAYMLMLFIHLLTSLSWELEQALRGLIKTFSRSTVSVRLVHCLTTSLLLCICAL